MDYTHIPDISCFYSEEDKASLRIPEAHFEYEMILVTEGSADFFINNRAYTLKKGALVFISRLERHHFLIKELPYGRYVASMSSHLIMSSIKDMDLVSIFTQRPENFCHMLMLEDDTYRILASLFMQLADEFSHQRAFFESKSTSLVVSILIELYRAHPDFFPNCRHNSLTDAVLSIQNTIHESYSQRLTLNELAEKNFIGSHALSLAFKDIVGIPFKEYLVLFRIAEAKKLLITTSLSVEAVSLAVGYLNVNNFIRIFKSKETLTPHQYRKQFSPTS